MWAAIGDTPLPHPDRTDVRIVELAGFVVNSKAAQITTGQDAKLRIDGFTRDFNIYDDDDQVRVLKGILSELKLDPKQHPPSMFRQLIDREQDPGSLDFARELTAGADPGPPRLLPSARARERANAILQATALDDAYEALAEIVRIQADRLARDAEGRGVTLRYEAKGPAARLPKDARWQRQAAARRRLVSDAQ